MNQKRALGISLELSTGNGDYNKRFKGNTFNNSF